MADNASREDFYGRIGARNLKPLWEVLRGQLTVEPNPPETAVLWRYDDVRPFLLEAARLISVEEADRRVLVLENPTMPGKVRPRIGKPTDTQENPTKTAIHSSRENRRTSVI